MSVIAITLSMLGLVLCVAGVVRNNLLLQNIGLFFTMVSLVLAFFK